MKSLRGKWCVIKTLCWDSGNKRFTHRALPNVWHVPFLCLSSFPSPPLGHWEGTCMDTCKAFRARGKSTAAEHSNTFPKTITHSPNHFPSKLPHCYSSAFTVTIGGKLSLIERGNISVSLQHLISNQNGYSKRKKSFRQTLHFFSPLSLIHTQNIHPNSFCSG